jgi:glycosyltransferase involved in cell wall biosynthesis
MKISPCLVTVGIPTFNRAPLLLRSINSLLGQTHEALEIIISDNASTDGTEDLCRELAANDRRIRYVRQVKNIGGTENFNYCLSVARGKFFMWLGDDDWIDPEYISVCLTTLQKDSTLSSVGGFPKYYRNGNFAFAGDFVSFLNKNPYCRLLNYYVRVMDNGTFYGLFRIEAIRKLSIPNDLAGDWHFLAEVLAVGRCRMLSATSVHRELGGATDSYRRLVAAYNLPYIAAFFPSFYVARSARKYMLSSNFFSNRKFSGLYIWSLLAVLFLRPISNIPYRIRRFFRVRRE